MGKTIRNSLLGVSIFYILIGLVMILWPETARGVACYVLGAAGVIYGAVEVIRYLRTRAFTVPEGTLLVGILSFLTGLLVIIKASAVTAILVALLGVLVVADSIMKLAYGLQLKRAGDAGWRFFLISGCVLVLLGLFMLIDPLGSANVMIILSGVFLILDGIGNLWFVIKTRDALKD